MLSWKAEHESSEDGSLASVRTARIALWCVPLLWASYNVVLRQIFDLEDAPTPSVLTLYRSLIASISLVAATAARKSVFSTLDETDTRRLAMASFELGLWNFCGTALQVAGLQWTTATRGGFLLSTCNVLVPMFAAIGGQSVNTTVWFSCLLAALGGTILSLDHAEGQTFAGGMQYLIRGDVAVLSSSVFFALATLRLDKHARENSNFLLVVGKTISMVGFSMMWVLLQDNAWQHPVEAMLAPAVQWNGEPFVWAMVIYSAVGPGGLAAWLQTVGQSRISASQAQTIYAMTPVFSAIMAPLLLSSEAERLGPYGYLGGGILIAAGLLAGLNEPN